MSEFNYLMNNIRIRIRVKISIRCNTSPQVGMEVMGSKLQFIC